MKDNSMYLVLAASAAGRELLPLERDLVNKFLLGDLSRAEERSWTAPRAAHTRCPFSTNSDLPGDSIRLVVDD